MASKKTLKINVSTNENGEQVFSTETQVYGIPFKGDEFYMTYFRFMAPLFKIKSLQDVKVLWQLTQYAEFSTGVVVLSPERRRHIEAITGVQVKNLSKHLASLRALHLITGDRNDYQISPVIFWRGNNKDRSAFMETDEGRRVVIEFRKCTDDGEDFPLSKQVKLSNLENFENE
jgi:hypothetical protein